MIGENVTVAFVDQGDAAAEAAAEHDGRWIVVRLPEAKHGFVLLARRWVVVRSLGWLSRFRRLVREGECLPELLADFRLVAFRTVMLPRLIALQSQSA